MNAHIPAFFREDLPRKLLALFLAVLICYTVRLQLHEKTIVQGVPVQLEYDRGNVHVEDTGLTVDIGLIGGRERISRIKTGDVRVKARIADFPLGINHYKLRLTKDNVKTPPGTRLDSIENAPDQVRVDRIVTKPGVPVRLRFEGQLADGYVRTRALVVPASVDIRGPSSILKDVREIVTVPIMLDETMTQSFEMDAKLVPIPRVQTPQEVHVSIEVSRHRSEQQFRDLDLHVLSRVGSRLRLDSALPKVAVTLQGPKTTLDGLDRTSVRPFVDTATITSPGTYRRPVQVWVDGAANTTAEYVFPIIVEVTLVDGSALALPSPPGTQPESRAPGPETTPEPAETPF